MGVSSLSRDYSGASSGGDRRTNHGDTCSGVKQADGSAAGQAGLCRHTGWLSQRCEVWGGGSAVASDTRPGFRLELRFPQGVSQDYFLQSYTMAIWALSLPTPHTHTHTPVAHALGFDVFFPTGNFPQDPGLASSFTSLESGCHHFPLGEISLDIYE